MKNDIKNRNASSQGENGAAQKNSFTFNASASFSKPDEKTVRFCEDIAAQVRADYEQRAIERRTYEAQWQLNSNFVSGNQYCSVNLNGALENIERDYYWQEREVFNHIAPIVETRLAKLNRVRPKMSVRPASGDDGDIKAAKTAGKILASCCNKLELDSKISQGTYWSETAGSVFYKIVWDPSAGRKLGVRGGREVFEGDVKIEVCPPYEIFPSSLSSADIGQESSIIHAKAFSVAEVKRLWGHDVSPEKLEVLGTSHCGLSGGLNLQSAIAGTNRCEAEDSCLVIERYTRPTAENPDGELAITAGGKLLYYGPLPYLNGDDFKRDLPFVKQDSINSGAFFGTSVIERAIPIQRAYNAVKNRKHEFMNRIAMGVMTVEDGSVDADNLIEEGLSPGKILVYRQGANPPQLLDPGRVPTDFHYEEDRLLSEFIAVSGVSEIMRSSSVPSALTSGVALQMLIEQDDTRLSVTAEYIRSAVRKTAKQVLRLYKQFCKTQRLSRFCGDNCETEVLCWNSSDISCDDVVFDTENELNSTPAAKQNMTLELLRMGLLNDENGKLSDSVRFKILDVLGYGGWEFTKDIMSLHINRAEKENLSIKEKEPQVLEIDDHKLHISSHTKFALSSDFEEMCIKNKDLKEKLLGHIRSHRQFGSIETTLSGGAADA